MYKELNLIRRCGICLDRTGQVNCFCNGCWKALHYKALETGFFSMNYNRSVSRLYTWESPSDNYLKKIVYQLKYGHSEEVYINFASWLLFKAKDYKPLCKDTVFLSAPGKKYKANHAQLLALALAKQTGLPAYNLLIDKTPSNQKRLNKRERMKKVFSCERADVLKNKKIIFVDDVITTGSTSEAVYRALNQPKHFRSWVILEVTAKSRNEKLNSLNS